MTEQQDQNFSASPEYKLKALGHKTGVPYEYQPSLLEVVVSPHVPVSGMVVQLVCTEFTSLCPVTGQPDFGSIVITYKTLGPLVESKSLKLYMMSFRNHRAFHEDIVCMIAKDLMDRLGCEVITVQGQFNLRGGIAIRPECTLKWEG